MKVCPLVLTQENHLFQRTIENQHDLAKLVLVAVERDRPERAALDDRLRRQCDIAQMQFMRHGSTILTEIK
jgi:hypothetical protein